MPQGSHRISRVAMKWAFALTDTSKKVNFFAKRPHQRLRCSTLAASLVPETSSYSGASMSGMSGMSSSSLAILAPFWRDFAVF